MLVKGWDEEENDGGEDYVQEEEILEEEEGAEKRAQSDFSGKQDVIQIRQVLISINFQVTIEAFVRTGLNNFQVCTRIYVKILSSWQMTGDKNLQLRCYA